MTFHPIFGNFREKCALVWYTIILLPRPLISDPRFTQCSYYYSHVSKVLWKYTCLNERILTDNRLCLAFKDVGSNLVPSLFYLFVRLLVFFP